MSEKTVLGNNEGVSLEFIVNRLSTEGSADLSKMDDLSALEFFTAEDYSIAARGSLEAGENESEIIEALCRNLIEEFFVVLSVGPSFVIRDALVILEALDKKLAKILALSGADQSFSFMSDFLFNAEPQFAKLVEYSEEDKALIKIVFSFEKTPRSRKAIKSELDRVFFKSKVKLPFGRKGH